MNNTFNIGAMDTVYPFIPMYPNGQPLSLIHIYDLYRTVPVIWQRRASFRPASG